MLLLYYAQNVGNNTNTMNNEINIKLSEPKSNKNIVERDKIDTTNTQIHDL